MGRCYIEALELLLCLLLRLHQAISLSIEEVVIYHIVRHGRIKSCAFRWFRKQPHQHQLDHPTTLPFITEADTGGQSPRHSTTDDTSPLSHRHLNSTSWHSNLGIDAMWLALPLLKFSTFVSTCLDRRSRSASTRYGFGAIRQPHQMFM